MRDRLIAVVVLLLMLTPAWSRRLANGVVTGQLRGASGAPGTGVRVAARAVSHSNSRGAGAVVSLAETDSNGRFRLENLPPGRYYIQAGFIDGPSYSPGVSAVGSATSILVTPG